MDFNNKQRNHNSKEINSGTPVEHALHQAVEEKQQEYAEQHHVAVFDCGAERDEKIEYGKEKSQNAVGEQGKQELVMSVERMVAVGPKTVFVVHFHHHVVAVACSHPPRQILYGAIPGRLPYNQSRVRTFAVFALQGEGLHVETVVRGSGKEYREGGKYDNQYQRDNLPSGVFEVDSIAAPNYMHDQEYEDARPGVHAEYSHSQEHFQEVEQNDTSLWHGVLIFEQVFENQYIYKSGI